MTYCKHCHEGKKKSEFYNEYFCNDCIIKGLDEIVFFMFSCLGIILFIRILIL